MILMHPLRSVLASLAGCASILAVSAVTVELSSATNAWTGRPGYLAPGGSATLQATGAAGALQWFFNGTPLPGATAATLALSPVVAAHSGNYFVRATDAAAVSESNWITLNILPPPAASAVDPTFTSALPPAASATHYYDLIWPLSDGGSVARRVDWGGVGYGTSYYRLRADGSLDPAFPQPIWATASVGPAQWVVAVLDDGTLLLPKPPYCMLATGIPAAGIATPSGLDPAIDLTGGIRQPDGRLLLLQGRAVLRVLADGARDPSFNFDPSFFTTVQFLQLDSAGRVVLAGNVNSTSAGRIVRLTSTGALDPTFAAIATDVVTKPTLLADGSLVVAQSGAARYTRYRADGVPAETWDLSRWVDSAHVRIGAQREVYIAYSGLGIFRLLDGADPTLDPGFFAACESDTIIHDLAMQPDGRLLLAGTFSRWGDQPTSGVVRIDPARVVAGVAPVVAVDARPPPIRGGAPLAVPGRAVGSGPLTFSWVALDGGKLPTDSTSPRLAFTSFQQENLGRYQLRVSGPGGSALSPVVDLRPTAAPRLLNLSGRTQVGTGEDILIAGLSIEMTTRNRALRLVLRGVGPALTQFGVQSALANPVLSLFNSDRALVERNDDWVDSPYARNWTTQAGAFPFAAGSRDAQLIRDAAGASYTLQLRDASDQPGLGLIEAYDVDTADPVTDPRPGELTNLSLRGLIGAGDAAMIAGFVVHDPHNLGRSLRLLIRAVGPALAPLGVAGAISNPRLTIYDGAGTALASNDDWSTVANAAEIAATTAQAGAFPLPAGSSDAALVREFPPGAYTAHAIGVGGATGVALIELYRVK